MLSINEDTRLIWENAFDAAKGEVPDTSKHQLNTILHIDTTPLEEMICPGDVWEVVKHPKFLFRKFEVDRKANDQAERMKREFLTYTLEGHELDKRAREEEDVELQTGYKKEYKEKCADPMFVAARDSKVAMVEISPSCDFANQKKPFNTVAIGILIPVRVISGMVVIKEAPSTICVKISHCGEDYILGISAKYITSLSEEEINFPQLNLRKIFRVRESLLQSWIHKISAYNSRIGTVSF